MFRLLPWIIAVLASLDLLTQTHNAKQSFLAALQLRRDILSNAHAALEDYCEKKQGFLRLSWRDKTGWDDNCRNFTSHETALPRYWKVEACPKIRLLFLVELPITMSIVILS